MQSAVGPMLADVDSSNSELLAGNHSASIGLGNYRFTAGVGWIMAVRGN
jgi:hypothetical protein